jgi:hypothetical protein
MRCNVKESDNLSNMAADGTRQAVPTIQCRFCGRCEPKHSANWRELKAPNDDCGVNRNVPPPLRVVYFCNNHYKPWIPSALKTMDMSVIMSHLVFGAKPCFESEQNFQKAKKTMTPRAKQKTKVARRNALTHPYSRRETSH